MVFLKITIAFLFEKKNSKKMVFKVGKVVKLFLDILKV